MIEFNTEGLTPTASFIEDQHTGKFVEILPNIFMIKGAKNDRGFDQAYAIKKGKKDLLLIDAVEQAYRKAIENLKGDGWNFEAIVITGKEVLNDAYADLQTISDDLGGATIYIHPDLAPGDGFKTKDLTSRDALMSSYDLEPQEVPGDRGEMVLYCTRSNGVVFAGDSAVGSDYGTDGFLFSREKLDNTRKDFAVSEFWKNYRKNFDYLLPRKGKPALEVDNRTRITVLDRIGRGSK